MEIFFPKKIAKILNDKKCLTKEFGDLIAKRIRIRLSVLQGAPSLSDVPTVKPDRCHPLKGDKKGMFAVDLTPNYRLIFKPNHDPIPTLKEGGIDHARITKITIVGVEDYHGN